MNCLGCHQVSAGTVSGVVRVDLALTAYDQHQTRSLAVQALTSLLVLGAGLAVLLLVLRRVLHRPLRELGETMQRIERDFDLTLRIHPVVETAEAVPGLEDDSITLFQ